MTAATTGIWASSPFFVLLRATDARVLRLRWRAASGELPVEFSDSVPRDALALLDSQRMLGIQRENEVGHLAGFAVLYMESQPLRAFLVRQRVSQASWHRR